MTVQQTPPAAPDAEELAAALAECGALQGAADAHGMLCALLCADPEIDAASWLASLGARVPGALPEPLHDMHAVARAQLAGERFDLELWLPGDTAPLTRRVEALAQWCQGYLGGLGLAGIGGDRLAGDAAEFVHDLAAIAQASHRGESPSEQAERDYAELVEFLRIGTYLVRDALNKPSPPVTPS
ncbi:MAG: UPF0149 family protein [Gammaproteobacteria bacterium]|nr:UPF0149 family protein [Gammaproteobacteria bacterium]